MRALLCGNPTGHRDLTVEDVPTPEITPGHVRVRVLAAGLNLSDTLIAKGGYQIKPEPPFVPGFECAGEVIEVADGNGPIDVGDMVIATPDHGALAEELVVPADHVFPTPEGMDPIEAAAVPVAYGTAHLGIKRRLNLAKGQTIVVHGAAGGVGLAGVEIAKAMELRVIATAGGAEKLKIARAAGADALIDHRSEDIRARVKNLTNGLGADGVYDPVGGDIFVASLRAVRQGGKILIVGFASGDVPRIRADILLVKNIEVIGHNWGAYKTLDPAIPRASFAEIFDLIAAGRLKPHVTRVEPLSGVVSALDDLKAGRTAGKVVVDLTADENGWNPCPFIQKS